MADKIYFNGVFIKKGKYGLKLTGKSADIIAEIQKHTNSKGYLNLELNERKEADKNGNTHYLTVDTWEPGAARPAQNQSVEDIEPISDLPF
jgi:hypothetical protein